MGGREVDFLETKSPIGLFRSILPEEDFSRTAKPLSFPFYGAPSTKKKKHSNLSSGESDQFVSDHQAPEERNAHILVDRF